VGRNPLRIFQELLIDRLSNAAQRIVHGEKKTAIGNIEKPPDFVIFGHTHKPCVKRITSGRRYINTGSWKMRAAPKGRLSVRVEQRLDFALFYRIKNKKWGAEVNSWAELMNQHRT
jgi:UDP-2,3-diacylglucosamine pyrophosphatase LpxH